MPALSRVKIGSNIFIAAIPGGTLFFSYETPVAAVIDGVAFATEHKWSVTTTQQINKWLQGRRPYPKPQAWFNAWGEGRNPDQVEAPVDPLKDVQVSLGGITLLIQQPGDENGVTRMVNDEEGFAAALSEEVEGFKWFDSMLVYGSVPSITLINGIIPVVIELPDEMTEPLPAWVNRKTQEVRQVWERFAV